MNDARRTRTDRPAPSRLLMALLAGAFNVGGIEAAAPAAPVQVVQQSGAIAIDVDLPAFELRPRPSLVRLVPFTPHELEVPGFRASSAAGHPALPARALLLAVPVDAVVELVIDETSFHEVENVWIEPPATSPRDADKDQVSYHAVPNAEVYSTDAFVPSTPAMISMRGVARDVDFVKVELYPFHWNPVRGTLRIYDHIAVRLVYDELTNDATGRDRGDAGDGRSRGSHSVLGSDAAQRTDSVRTDSVRTDSVLASMFANGPIPSSWRQRRPAPDAKRIANSFNRPATIERIAATDVYKVEVATDGLYRVTLNELQFSGARATRSPFTDFTLRLRGQRVPTAAIDIDGDGWFDLADAIVFVGQANPERYSKTHVYWMSIESGAIPMPEESAFPDGHVDWPNVSSARRTARFEVNDGYFDTSPIDPDAWNPWIYRTSLQSHTGSPCGGASGATTLDVVLDTVDLAPPVPGRSYDLRARLAASAETPCIPAEQVVSLSLNGQSVGTAAWSTAASGILYDAVYATNPATILPGQNTVTLDQPTVAGMLRRTFVDWIELDYEAHLIADNDRLEVRGTWVDGAVVYMRGFTTTNLEAIDVRSDGRTVRLDGVRAIAVGPGLPVTATLALPPSSLEHRILVYARPALIVPTVVPEVPSDLRDPANLGAHLTIAHADFMAAAAPITQHHIDAGRTAQLIDVQDVYDEFSWGNVSPDAIRDFLSLAISASPGGWADPPMFVVLVGDTTNDPLDYRGYGVRQYVPHREFLATIEGATRHTASDPSYTFLVGNDVVPDLLLGRLPAQSAAEVTMYADKLIRYESRPAIDAWNSRSMLVADDDMLGVMPNNGCEVAQNGLELLLENIACCYLGNAPASDRRVVLEDEYGWPAGHDVLVDAINDGVAMWLYYGHGSVTRLGKKCDTSFLDIYGSPDATSTTNPDALPLFASVSCNVGTIEWVDRTTGYSRCMSEVFTMEVPNGNLGFISSSRSISAADGIGQIVGMMDGMFQPGSTYLPPWPLPNKNRLLGGIHFASQIGMLLNPTVQPLEGETNVRALLLSGDPAAHLKLNQPPPPSPETCPVPGWCPNR